MGQLLLLDCDSTLSAIEGIDELARLSGPETFAAVQAMTREAMDGTVPIDAVFQRRLDLIRPSRAMVDAVGRLYVENAEPHAADAIAAARAEGWTPIIVSGGFAEAIRPLADWLGIARVEAVGLRFGAGGDFAGYDEAHPATRTGGKLEIIAALRTELAPERIVMVGDGVSDLETAGVVDRFVGFGRYADRQRVREGAGRFIRSMAELPAALEGL